MGRGTKPDMIAIINTCPNQRQMRVWHLSKSTPNARLAFGGFRFALPEINGMNAVMKINLLIR